MAAFYVGQAVRYFSVANGWMFGRVRKVYPVGKGDTGTTVEVFFPGSTSRYRPYATCCMTLHSWFVERCGDAGLPSPEECQCV